MARPRTRNNFKALIKDELVTRFENVIVDEINIYNSNIKKTESEINELRHLLDKVFYHLDISKSEQKIKDGKIRERLDRASGNVEDSCFKQNKKIYEAINEINQVKERVIFGLNLLSTKQEIKEHHEKITQELRKVKQLVVDKDNDYTRKLQALFEEKNKIMHEFFFTCSHEIQELKQEIEDLKKQIALLNLENAGFKKDILFMKNEKFVMSKKIEHIYGLLGRTSEGG